MLVPDFHSACRCTLQSLVELLRRNHNLDWLNTLDVHTVMDNLGDEFRRTSNVPPGSLIHLVLWIDDLHHAHKKAEAAGWSNLGQQIGQVLAKWAYSE